MKAHRTHKTKRIASPELACFVVLLFSMMINCSWAQEENRNEDPEAEFHIARLIYSNAGRNVREFRGFGRPWWAIDWPDAEYHFTRGVRRLTRINIANDSQHLELTEDEIFDYPWLFAQQVGRWYLTDLETARLREYLLRGGFLLADDFHGAHEWEIFIEVIRRVFPQRPIVDIPTNDEVMHVLYDLNKLTQIPGRRHLYRNTDSQIVGQLAGPQKWRGIYDEKGRLLVAINFNMDMGDAWEHADDPIYPEPMTALAYRFGINYVIYAMTH